MPWEGWRTRFGSCAVVRHAPDKRSQDDSGLSLAINGYDSGWIVITIVTGKDQPRSPHVQLEFRRRLILTMTHTVRYSSCRQSFQLSWNKPQNHPAEARRGTRPLESSCSPCRLPCLAVELVPRRKDLFTDPEIVSHTRRAIRTVTFQIEPTEQTGRRTTRSRKSAGSSSQHGEPSILGPRAWKWTVDL